ncbi:MAG: hypothetical protein WDW36_005020 [Sanguina aurantia]
MAPPAGDPREPLRIQVRRATPHQGPPAHNLLAAAPSRVRPSLLSRRTRSRPPAFERHRRQVREQRPPSARPPTMHHPSPATTRPGTSNHTRRHTHPPRTPAHPLTLTPPPSLPISERPSSLGCTSRLRPCAAPVLPPLLPPIRPPVDGELGQGPAAQPDPPAHDATATARRRQSCVRTASGPTPTARSTPAAARSTPAAAGSTPAAAAESPSAAGSLPAAASHLSCTRRRISPSPAPRDPASITPWRASRVTHSSTLARTPGSSQSSAHLTPGPTPDPTDTSPASLPHQPQAPCPTACSEGGKAGLGGEQAPPPVAPAQQVKQEPRSTAPAGAASPSALLPVTHAAARPAVLHAGSHPAPSAALLCDCRYSWQHFPQHEDQPQFRNQPHRPISTHTQQHTQLHNQRHLFVVVSRLQLT